MFTVPKGISRSSSVLPVLAVFALTACDAELTSPNFQSLEAPGSASLAMSSSGTSTGSVPELPRLYVDTRMPALSGQVIQVARGGDLQAALNQAKPGDVIELQAGATYQGSFTLPAKSGNGWIVIRSSAHAQLPAGRRVRPADAPLMAKLVGGQRNLRVVKTAPGAHHYRFIGIEIAADVQGLPGVLTTLVDFDNGSRDLILDRTYVHGQPETNLQRCITLNSGAAAVVDSYVDDCHADGFDSQAILGWNGSGPYKIVNNYLAGAGENIMFGGAAIGAGEMPADIEIRGNHIHKPLHWRGKWTVKNLFELKMAERVLIEGNVLENNWADAQVGFAVVIKSENRDVNSQSDIATQDITFRNNLITNSRFGISLTGRASTQAKSGAGRTSRILIQNNLLEVDELRSLEFLGTTYDLIVENNTLSSAMNLEGAPHEGFVFRRNVMTGRIKGSGLQEGMATLDVKAPGAVFHGNAVAEIRSDLYPQGNGNSYPAVAPGFSGSVGVDKTVLDAAIALAIRGS